MHFLFKFIVSGIILYIGVSAINSDDDYSYDDDYDDDYNSENNSTTNATLQFIRELTNTSRDIGSSVKLRCDVRSLDVNVTLSKISIKWLKNEAWISDDDSRIKIKRHEMPETRTVSSRLRMVRLETLDTGFYTCLASDGRTKIRSQNLLSVSKEKWGGSGMVGDLPKYESVYPDATNLHPDLTTLLPNSERTERDDDELPTDEDGVFGARGRPVVSPQAGSFANYSVTEPFCQVYIGNTCKLFLDDKYVFIQPPYTQKELEQKINNAYLVISHSKDLSDSCREFALPSLCYSAFPLCDDDQLINMKDQPLFVTETKNLSPAELAVVYRTVRDKLALRRVCREDCELLENELCRSEYAIAKRHPVIGPTLQLEECASLPLPGQPNANKCLQLRIDRFQNVQADDDCYWGNGAAYRGIRNVSTNGLKCLKWTHQFHIPLSNHPELAGHGYCRNPDELESAPFCYVEQTRRERCDVPKCATYIWIYISLAFVICLAGGVGTILYFCCSRNRDRSNPRSLQNMNVPTADKNIYGSSRLNSPMELNPMLPNHNQQRANQQGATGEGGIPPPLRNQNIAKSSFQNVPNYTYKELTFVEELGEGAFGKVYKGELKTKSSGKIFVAVKALKENASAKTQADFQREIDLISELRHPNIICLLGIIVKQEPLCMLFEFMSEGDLHEFLRANSPTEGGAGLAQHDFLHIALQIALGMEYLSGNHYVHRDLAARNCLVSKDLVVKISDFGLSRDMYSCDYYRVQSKSLLPVRWMPPESILYGKFTTESDVWSYGVVLWEIYSYGLQPYYGYNNQEVINMIRSRKLLPCPDNCPSYCYSLMVECWAELAVRRPSFAEICHRLRVWKQNGVQMMTTGAYFKPSASSSGQSSRASTEQPRRTNDQQPSLTWDTKRSQQHEHDLHESQSSLTSRTSSLGNRTQSTGVSTSDQNSAARSNQSRRPQHDRRQHHRPRRPGAEPANDEPTTDQPRAKDTVVSTNGDNVETTLTDE